MQAQKLIDSIKDVFIHQDAYAMHKYVPEFFLKDTFLGDYFNYFIFEPRGENPPRIYHTASPYDPISKKAPQQALVYCDGKVELNIDFTEYADMRTGVMDALLLQTLGVKSLREKRIVIYGTGKISRCSLRYLKEIFPDLETVDIVNASGNVDPFIQFASECGVKAVYVKTPDISLYDVIIMHTSTNHPIITASDISKIKKGAIITSYRTTSEHGELENDLFNSDTAHIITDWEDSINFVSDLKAAHEKGILIKENVHYLKDVIEGRSIDVSDKAYTVFRSTGTPMQNVATLKLIMQE